MPLPLFFSLLRFSIFSRIFVIVPPFFHPMTIDILIYSEFAVNIVVNIITVVYCNQP
jgi:hypothetical protein